MIQTKNGNFIPIRNCVMMRKSGGSLNHRKDSLPANSPIFGLKSTSNALPVSNNNLGGALKKVSFASKPKINAPKKRDNIKWIE
jgi:hypothetical protein